MFRCLFQKTKKGRGVMKKRIWYILFLIPLLLTIGSQRSAAQHIPNQSSNEQVQIILHKLLFTEGNLPDPQKNTGEEQVFFQEAQGINEVSFSVYDVTASFYQLREQGIDVTTAQQQLAKKGQEIGTFVTEQITKTVGNEAGIAQFQLPKQDAQGRDQVYLFQETKTPVNVKEKSANLVVVLPINNEQGQELKTIHLYPKNEETTPLSFLEKKIQGDSSVSFGEIVTYTVDTIVSDCQSYQLIDEADDHLFFLPDTWKLKIGGQEIHSGYKMVSHQNGFELTLAKETLQKMVGQPLSITYQMQVSATAIPDEELKNNVTVTTEREYLQRSTAIRTGGKHFLKIDSRNQRPLQGAVFLVRNQRGKYLHQTKEGVTWRMSSEGAYRLTSDQSGNFSVRGLTDGNYYLEEIQSPKGYIKSEELIPFVVEKNSFQQNGQQADPLKVKNRKADFGLMPKTNEKNSQFYVIVGLILVSISLWKWRKKGENK